MRDWEEINRQENQYAIWKGKPGIYEEPWPLPDRSSKEHHEQWLRQFNARWEGLKRGDHEQGDCRTDATGTETNGSVHDGPGNSSGAEAQTEKDTECQR